MVTVKQLQAAKPGEWVSDGGARGAGVLQFRRSASGAMLAYFRYTLPNGRRDTLPIGLYDETGRNGLTLSEFRDKAGDFSRLYQSGVKDIRAHLAAEEAARKAAEDAAQAAREAAEAARRAAEIEATIKAKYTLKALCLAYIDILEQAGKTKSSKDVRSAFKLHVIDAHPDLASRPAREITSHHIASIVRKVREAGKERLGGTLRSYLRTAFALAIRAPFDSGLPSDLIGFEVTTNPVDAIPTIPVRAGKRTLSVEELRQYMQQLDDNNLVDRTLKLALWSGGQRIAQLLRARIGDYDVSHHVLRLWDAKGKRLEPREHLLPLGPQAASLVESLIERAKNKTKTFDDMTRSESTLSLFYSTGDTVMVATTPGKRVLEIATAIRCEAFDIRDLRRTVETQLASLGISREVRAQLLSHGLSGVQVAHYDRHSYMDEKRAALQRWEHHLEALTSP